MPVKEAVDFLCSMYLDFAIPAFRLTHSGVKPETQIHTHMCYSEFTDIIPAIDDMDADVITFEASRSDLIRYLKPKEDFCFLGACYPECHPESENKIREMRHLREKVDAGAEVLLSQLFFDNEQFFKFVEDCRIAGIQVPIIPGIMPVINARQIKRMVTMCGASFPERFQRIIHKYEDNKEALFDAGMSYALSQIIDLLVGDIDGIHLYTMNNPLVARRICDGIRNII